MGQASLSWYHVHMLSVEHSRKFVAYDSPLLTIAVEIWVTNDVSTGQQSRTYQIYMMEVPLSYQTSSQPRYTIVELQRTLRLSQEFGNRFHDRSRTSHLRYA